MYFCCGSIAAGLRVSVNMAQQHKHMASAQVSNYQSLVSGVLVCIPDVTQTL